MHRRKIQLIAGTTYSVSLPKEWIKKNNLKEKTEISIHEKNDRTLVITPGEIEIKKQDKISLNIDNYAENIDQVLFAVYYLGIENITVYSDHELTKDVKTRVRKTLTNMSGTEISYEDKQKITIKVLLDKSKVDIIQTFYRISLLLESSITNIQESFDIKEIKINEDEIDRLYHLIAKIVSLALIDSNILYSSNIKNISLVPSFFMMSKRLENVGDNISHLSKYLHKNKLDLKMDILSNIKSELNRSIKHLMAKQEQTFEKITNSDLDTIFNSIEKTKDKTISNYLYDIVRYLIDIEEEIVNISFYNQLIGKGML